MSRCAPVQLRPASRKGCRASLGGMGTAGRPGPEGTPKSAAGGQPCPTIESSRRATIASSLWGKADSLTREPQSEVCGHVEQRRIRRTLKHLREVVRGHTVRSALSRWNPKQHVRTCNIGAVRNGHIGKRLAIRPYPVRHEVSMAASFRLSPFSVSEWDVSVTR
jgi:hypothetical protein